MERTSISTGGQSVRTRPLDRNDVRDVRLPDKSVEGRFHVGFGTTMGETTIIIPFSLPATLLAIGWWRAVSAERENRRSADWRSRCTWLALLFATISTIAAAAFWFSWNASGGSPHGLMPSPGPWVRFRVLWECSVIATFATIIFSIFKRSENSFAGSGRCGAHKAKRTPRRSPQALKSLTFQPPLACQFTGNCQVLLAYLLRFFHEQKAAQRGWNERSRRSGQTPRLRPKRGHAR